MQQPKMIGVFGRCEFPKCKTQIHKYGAKKWCDFHRGEIKKTYMYIYNKKRRPSCSIFYKNCQFCTKRYISRTSIGKWCSLKCKYGVASIKRKQESIWRIQEEIEEIKRECLL